MKIKLVTFAPHPNFGTCLQGYALSYVLRKMGHDVEFIYNRREVPPQTIKGYIGIIGKWILRKFLTEQQINYVKGKVKPKGKNQMANSVPYVLTLPNHPVLKMFSKMPGYQWFAKNGIMEICKNAKFISLPFVMVISRCVVFIPSLIMTRSFAMQICS